VLRRTKIIATIGPASTQRAPLASVLDAGADVVRLNLAHGTIEAHSNAAALARELAAKRGRVIGVLVDLPGPKMRTGPIDGGEVALEAGTRFGLTSQEVEGDARRVSTSVQDLSQLVAVDDEVYLADGAIVLRVAAVSDEEVTTEVVRGGILRSRKGMHVPGAERRIRAFTEQDAAALHHAVRFGADLIGLSFVRDADDVRRARASLPDDQPRPLIVAKIETRSAVEQLGAIVDEADAVMVARGDLGIQMSLREVPLLQKDIIRTCNLNGVPVITATQMLESMTHAPLPTRAEVADVANAVLDGTGALMLSEETAVGDHPAAAVAAMAEVAEQAETALSDHLEPDSEELVGDPVAWAVARAAVEAAEHLNVAAILCPTQSGATVRRVAAFRPAIPIVGLSAQPRVLGTMAMIWGVTPLACDELQSPTDGDGVGRAVDLARHRGVVRPGDVVVVVAGSGAPPAGRTDFMRIVDVQ
jgi:pyruvate kinase